jgi:hypothetical protein
VWCYFVLQLTKLVKTSAVGLMTALFRRGGVLQAIGGAGQSGGKDGRKGRAA